MYGIANESLLSDGDEDRSQSVVDSNEVDVWYVLEEGVILVSVVEVLKREEKSISTFVYDGEEVVDLRRHRRTRHWLSPVTL